ncbi:cytochrome P450 [Aspergillus spinulosporus]
MGLPLGNNLWIPLVSLLVAIITSLLVALVPYTWASLRPKNFPPGPKPLPLIGNLNLIPPSKAFLLFHQWTKKYGSIIGLKFGPTNVVVLNNWRDVQEQLIANELICKNHTHILFAPYGDGWKALRRAAQGLFTPRKLASVLPIQEAEAIQTAFNLIRSPDWYYKHIQQYTTAVILASALYNIQNRFTVLLEPGAAPPCALYFRLYNATKERMAKEIRTGCFMEKLIDDQVKNALDNEHTTYLSGILIEAGSDTTLSTLLLFLLAILKNPVNLPYIEACMHKILRWKPVAAGGIPHMLIQTDTYKDYIFPAGTIFFANTWAIHHDKTKYSNPAIFNPDRWLNRNKYGTKDNNSTLDLTAQRKTSYGWGAGRRICSGQKMAEALLKINIAKLVWAFDFERVKGEETVDISVDTGYEGGFLVCPKKFPIKITPRSEGRVAVIKKEFEGLKGFYEKLAS